MTGWIAASALYLLGIVPTVAAMGCIKPNARLAALVFVAAWPLTAFLILARARR